MSSFKNGRRAKKMSGIEAWFAQAEKRIVEDDGLSEHREQLALIRQQLDLLVQYRSTCVKLQAFARSLRARGDFLVPLRFPLRPTPRNRQSIGEGILRSFTRFIGDLLVLCLTTNTPRLECLRHDANSPLVARLARVLAQGSGRVLDREANDADATRGCVQIIESIRNALVREECGVLSEMRDACRLIGDVMVIFSKRWTGLKKKPQRADMIFAGKAFLKTAARQGSGLSHAVHTLCKRRRMAAVFEPHAWLTKQYAGFTDDEVVDVWNDLVNSHAQFSQAVSWEVRRVDWLSSTSAANACWDGVALASNRSPAPLGNLRKPCEGEDETSGVPQGFREGEDGEDVSDDGGDDVAETWAANGALVHAPAHMATFVTLERLRLVSEPQTSPFSSYLSTVRVTNVVLELLLTKRLVLGRISADYAQRIVAFDFSKYETAAARIVVDTLNPFGQNVGLFFEE